MTPILSLLLATVQSRADLFATLHAHLAKQADGKSVELIVACDNKEISIGKKRQNLLELAQGKYVAFIDDDDWISENYVDAILRAASQGPDCIGFEIRCTFNGGVPKRAVTSMRYKTWADNVDGYSYVRPPYHKTAILRELALKAGFPDLRYAEDRVFSDKVIPLIKSEVFIPEQLYHYRFRNEPFRKKYGFPDNGRRDHKGRRV